MGNSKVISLPRSRNCLYVLSNNNQVVPTTDYGEWAASLVGNRKSRKRTRTAAHVVTTVFIGVDTRKNFNTPGPRVFEVITEGVNGYYSESSYCTYKAAIKGHRTAVRRAVVREIVPIFYGAFSFLVAATTILFLAKEFF